MEKQIPDLALTRSPGSHSVCLCVPFVNSSLNLHAVSQLSLSCLSVDSQLSLSCLSTLLASSQQSFCNLYQFPSSLSEFSQSRYSKQSDPNIVRLVLVYKFIH